MDVHPPKNGINRYWSIAIFYNDEHISWSFLEACHDRCLSLSGQAGQAPLAAPRRDTSRIASCKSSGRADFQWQTFPASVWPTKTNHSMALEFLQFVALKRLYLKFIRLSVFPQIIFPEINQHIYVCYIYILLLLFPKIIENRWQPRVSHLLGHPWQPRRRNPNSGEAWLLRMYLTTRGTMGKL